MGHARTRTCLRFDPICFTTPPYRCARSACAAWKYAERMLSGGANGYVTKQATREQILRSLRCVIDGGVYVSEAVASNMIRGATAGWKRFPVNPVDRLSNRELQVLHSLGKGMSTRETAHSLNLSIKTIESHRQRIKGKLNLRSGTQLMQFAVNWFCASSAAA